MEQDPLSLFYPLFVFIYQKTAGVFFIFFYNSSFKLHKNYKMCKGL